MEYYYRSHRLMYDWNESIQGDNSFQRECISGTGTCKLLTAIEHLIKVWIHLKNVELKNNAQETNPNIEDGQESSNSSTNSTDELENFLKNKDKQNDSESIDFNLSNSQTSAIATN
ncbi:Dimer Tnp hAT domain-containing protein [Aphis craccivora]|uniref:Dimer Tnp hAT domain-containing protein n=1 Tax=Aphis craccivora TaxID=307492 RepID=A0A6G0ZH27_APHCR|nr:Dimer Tnp hAT domain-containing protein [Aphis craccivora]